MVFDVLSTAEFLAQSLANPSRQMRLPWRSQHFGG
jgi:hypothetical protein